MIETFPYVRKPFKVYAVQITDENMQDAATWCQGTILTDETRNQNRWIQVEVHRPQTPRQSRAYVGDWLLFAGKGFKIYTDRAFRSSFDQVPNGAAVMQESIVTQAPTIGPNPKSSMPKRRSAGKKASRRPAHVGTVGKALEDARVKVTKAVEVVEPTGAPQVTAVYAADDAQLRQEAEWLSTLSEDELNNVEEAVN